MSAANVTSTSMSHQHHYHHHQEIASLAALQGGNSVSTSGAGALLFNYNFNYNNNNYYTGKGKGSAAGNFETSSSSSSASFPRFHSSLHGMSMDWTNEEQAVLDEGLIRYASESNIARYAKIAMHLENKTIRDVALRCKWLSKRDFSKRRKEDFNLIRKGKEKKEKNPDPSAMSSSHAVMQSTFAPYGHGLVANISDNGFSYEGTSEAILQLLQQNVQAFEQISSNLVNHQILENIGLLCQARDNISQIWQNLDRPLNSGKHMPPLPVKINEDLARFILPLLTH